MTTQEITDTINAHFASAGELATTLGLLKKQTELRQVEIEIDSLNAKRTEILKPLEDARIELNNRRLAILGELAPADK